MTTPAVSVVMATCNRATLVQQAIAAVEAQTGIDFEIIVVVDGSTDGTPAVLERLAAASNRLVPVILDTNVGPATARNIGWRTARADVVVFTDDDCRPQPGWLENLVGGLADADIAQGRTLPDPAQDANQGPFSRTIRVETEEGYYETCNLAYRRAVLEAEGGFDQAFRLPYGEDTDLAWRAKKHGSRSTFVAEAVVFHEVWPSDFRAHFKDMGRRGGVVHVFSKHPELRAHLHKRLFFRPLHQQAVLAAAGLGALALQPTSRPRWAAATGLGLFYAWTCRRYRHHPPRRRDWAIVVPLAFAADLYDVAVMARASVRYRTLLL